MQQVVRAHIIADVDRGQRDANGDVEAEDDLHELVELALEAAELEARGVAVEHHLGLEARVGHHGVHIVGVHQLAAPAGDAIPRSEVQ
jgi:hypothetical protein